MLRRRVAISSAAMLIVLLLASACDSPDGPQSHPIVGTWLWDQSCGGIAGWCYYADSVDYSQYLHFSERTYTMYRDDSLLHSGAYRITREAIRPDDTVEVVTLQHNDIQMIISKLTEDSLHLSDLCYDCYFHVYHRLHPI